MNVEHEKRFLAMLRSVHRRRQVSGIKVCMAWAKSALVASPPGPAPTIRTRFDIWSYLGGMEGQKSLQYLVFLEEYRYDYILSMLNYKMSKILSFLYQFCFML